MFSFSNVSLSKGVEPNQLIRFNTPVPAGRLLQPPQETNKKLPVKKKEGKSVKNVKKPFILKSKRTSSK